MQSVKLNLIPGAVLPVVNVSQYDVKRTFALAVYDGAASYDLTGKTVTIRGTKPDNHGFDYGTSDGVVSVSGNTVTISTTQQMTAVGGHVMAELRIESGTTIIGTLNFIIDVEPSALSDDTIISDTEIPVIERSAWEQVEQAEKWATGAHDGTPVGPSEPQFENSAKWWAQHASTLGGLTDVDIESPTNDQVLKYDSATQKWKNGTGGGGASALDDLTDVDITNAADGDLLQYNSTSQEWENNSAVPDAIVGLEQTGAVNLCPNEMTSSVTSGVTLTKNDDDTISTDNTATGTFEIIICAKRDVTEYIGKTLYISGSVGGASNTYRIYCNVFNSSDTLLVNNSSTDGEAAITIPSGASYAKIGLLVYSGQNMTGKTFKPMLSLISGANYQPYALTNKELTDITDITGVSYPTQTAYEIYTGAESYFYKTGKIVVVSLFIKSLTEDAQPAGRTWKTVISGLPKPYKDILQFIPPGIDNAHMMQMDLVANGDLRLRGGSVSNSYDYAIYLMYIAK